MRQGHSKIPNWDGGTSTIDGANEQQLTEAYRLLAEVYQLLDQYAPVWYSADLRDRLQTALRPPERNTTPRHSGRGGQWRNAHKPPRLLK